MNALNRMLSLLLTTLIFALPVKATAEEGDVIYLHTSLYTRHFSPKPDHNNNQNLINVELLKPSDWIYGFALLNNSHDQSTQFIYAGRKWTLPKSSELLYFKLVGGLQHGYRGEHKDDVPLNKFGISPILLPAFGMEYKRAQTELIFFGAGFTWTAGINF